MAFGLFALALTLWVLGAIGLEAYGRRQLATRKTYDAVVVAGAKLRRGGLPREALIRRIALGVRLFRSTAAKELVLTGGVGEYPPAEAEVAAAIARKLGVPDPVLRIENESSSTEENARFARRLIGDQRVVVATDAYHVLRCQWIYGRYFMTSDVVGVPPERLFPPQPGALREVLAIGFYPIARWYRNR